MRVLRVLRGGSVQNGSRGLRTTRRSSYLPEEWHWYGGFRIVVQRRKP